MALSIRQLCKEYPNGVLALDRLDLNIGKGMFGLLGPNGAGKSTLMRTIATLQLPNSGKIVFNEIDVLNEPIALRKIMGYLPQEFGVYPRVSAWRLLDYLAQLKGLSNTANRRVRVGELLEMTNLYAQRNKAVSTFSGGMKRRFGIAQLLLNDPRLIIVDEPTAGLDPSERRHFLNLLRQLGADATVLFSTHIVEDIRALCQEMAVMHHGRILLQTTPQEAVARLEGLVWTTPIPASGLEDAKSKYRVLSVEYTQNQELTIRVFSHERPGDRFQIADPNLGDVYFYTLNHEA